MLIAADDALKSASEAGDRRSEKVDRKFATAIHLLSGFEMDFPSKDPSRPTSDDDSDPNIPIPLFGKMVTRMSDTSKSPSKILHSLKKDLHSTKVKFLSGSSPLNADEF